MSINSAALRTPELIDQIAARYGSQFVVVAIDARHQPLAPGQAEADALWTVCTHGGTQPTDRELYSWAHEAQERGAGEILFTSMNHDGTKHGYPCTTYARLTAGLRIPVIASGGAGSAHDIAEVLAKGHADAALAASIFHYGEITIPELKQTLSHEGIPVRL